MEHEHSSEAIKERLSAGPRHSYLRDWVYGGIDGSVTTFAVVAGVIGAEMSLRVILVIGAANIIADGFSMAASNYLGTKAEHDEIKQLETIEYRHIEMVPDGEREEVRQIFQEKGFQDNDLERAVELITSDRDRWVKTMLKEEYGLPMEVRSPGLAALSTFSAFIVCGLVPLFPFILNLPNPFPLATTLTGAVFFLIGTVKSIWSTIPWWRSGLETLLIGSVAATLAYLAGVVLERVS